MTLAKAKLVNKVAKVMLMISGAVIIAIVLLSLVGKMSIRYVSVPIMAGFIGVAWFASSKLAIKMMEEEAKTKAKEEEEEEE